MTLSREVVRTMNWDFMRGSNSESDILISFLYSPFSRTFYFLVAWADRWASATRRSKVEKAKKHIQEYKSKRHAKGKH